MFHGDHEANIMEPTRARQGDQHQHGSGVDWSTNGWGWATSEGMREMCLPDCQIAAPMNIPSAESPLAAEPVQSEQ